MRLKTLQRAALLGAPLLSMSGCIFGAPDQCNGGATKCDGNALLTCQPRKCSEPGCDGTTWKRNDCAPGHCVTATAFAGAECVTSPTDTRCNDNAYCDGNAIVTCEGGSEIAPRYDCGSAGCSATTGTASCIGESDCAGGALLSAPGTYAPIGDSCGTPQVCGDFVTWIELSGSPPVAQGGSVLVGRYRLTRAVDFSATPPFSSTIRSALIIDGIQMGSFVDDGTSPLAKSGTYATSGTSLFWHVTCPPNSNLVETIPYAYSATPTSLTLYDENAELLFEYQRVI